MKVIEPAEGAELMRCWGVNDWHDPGAEYVEWGDCCVFALVQQAGFVDVYMAMKPGSRARCRKAGAELLLLIGHIPLRAVILPDRISVCNFAARMGFTDRQTQYLQTIDGSTAPFFVMWRKPGEYDGRSNQRVRRGGK